MPAKEIIKQSPPVGSMPLAKFTNDVNSFVNGQGYDVFIEKSLRCPCYVKASGSPLPSCENCGGTGWVFLGITESIVSLTSMNSLKNFSSWSETNRGIAKITARYVDRLSFMDRITLQKATSIFTQVLKPILNNNIPFPFTIYSPTSVDECRMFIDVKKPLKKLVSGTDFTFEGNKIIFDPKFGKIKDFTVTVRYQHLVQYHIIDIVRDVLIKNLDFTICSPEASDPNINNLPLAYIGRRAHFVLDAPNFDSQLLLNE